MVNIKIIIIYLFIFLFSLVFVSADFCLQETANVSTACGGLNTGSYSWVGHWECYSEDIMYMAFDGNYSSHCLSLSDSESEPVWDIFYVNYTVPMGAMNNSLWQVKASVIEPNMNYTINSSCWNSSLLQFRKRSSQPPTGYENGAYIECYNQTDWLAMESIDYRNTRATSLYEEAMFWNITGDYIWSFNYSDNTSWGNNRRPDTYRYYYENYYCDMNNDGILCSDWNLPLSLNTLSDMIYNNNLTLVDYILWVNSTNPSSSGSGDNTSWNESFADTKYHQPSTCAEGYVVQNTTLGGVECVLNTEPSTTYYANNTDVSGGSFTDRNQINDTYYYDGLYHNFTEGGGALPLTVYINYTNVTSFSQWIIREYYLGSASHFIQFQIWDYDDSTWENYFEIVGQTGMTWLTIPVYDDSEHIQDGLVQTRMYHVQNGVSSHRLYIDVSWLIDGNNIGASTNLDGYARYNFGYNSFNGNGDFNTTGQINASYFSGNGSKLTDVCLSNGTNCAGGSGDNVSWNQSYADALYLKLDTTNNPLTGDLNISKASPKITLTATDDSSYNAEIKRNATNREFIIRNDVGVPSANPYAVNLDGTSGYVDLATAAKLPNGASKFTVAYWVYFDSYNVDQGSGYNSLYISRGAEAPAQSHHHAVKTDGSFWILHYAPDQDTGYNFATGQWTHVMEAYDGRYAKIYINGDLYTTLDQGTLAVASSTTYVGRHRNYADYYMDGKIDQLAFWSTNLSDGNATRLYNSGNGYYFTSTDTNFGGSALKGLWQFDEGTGTTTADGSGNLSTGTLMSTASWATGKVTLPSTVTSSVVVSSIDGSLGGEKGIHRFGDNAGKNVFRAGTTQDFTIASTTLLSLSSRAFNYAVNSTRNDNIGEYYGTDNDASIAYDGTNLVINPKSYGSGKIVADTMNIFSLGTTSQYFGVASGAAAGATAIQNTAVGYNAGDSITDGDQNTMLGAYAGQGLTSALRNVLLGSTAMYSATSGDSNVIIGADAARLGTSGTNNAIVGYYSAYGSASQPTGSRNAILGSSCLQSASTADDNTLLGYGSASVMSTGDRNIFIGSYSGSRQTGSDTLLIDNQQRASIAVEETDSIIYGQMDSLKSMQNLTFNANTLINGTFRTIKNATFEGNVSIQGILFGGSPLKIGDDINMSDNKRFCNRTNCYSFNDFVNGISGGSDNISWNESYADTKYLELDQTTQQTIVNGMPIFNQSLIIGDGNASDILNLSFDGTTSDGIIYYNGAETYFRPDRSWYPYYIASVETGTGLNLGDTNNPWGGASFFKYGLNFKLDIGNNAGTSMIDVTQPGASTYFSSIYYDGSVYPIRSNGKNWFSDDSSNTVYTTDGTNALDITGGIKWSSQTTDGFVRTNNSDGTFIIDTTVLVNQSPWIQEVDANGYKLYNPKEIEFTEAIITDGGGLFIGGDYNLTGVYNNKPYYYSSVIGAWIYWNQLEGKWYISGGLTDEPLQYFYSDSGDLESSYTGGGPDWTGKTCTVTLKNIVIDALGMSIDGTDILAWTSLNNDLKLDQSTPQSVINGAPYFESGITLGPSGGSPVALTEESAYLQVYGGIKPQADNSYELGEASKYWSNLYAMEAKAWTDDTTAVDFTNRYLKDATGAVMFNWVPASFSLTDGTASWTSNSLSSFTSISGTTVTDGTCSMSGGTITACTSITATSVGDGTCSITAGSLDAGCGGVSDTYDDGTDTVITFTNGLATGIATAYDNRLMQNITYINEIDRSKYLTPVEFKWNPTGLKQFGSSLNYFKDKTYIGFTAQDVMNFYPSCVVGESLNLTGTKTTYYQYNRNCISAMQSQELASLKDRVTKLEALIK